MTNYEISSKSVQTVGGSYAIERLSVAVLVNKAALVARLGEKADGLLDKRVAELTELVSTAAGVARDRGDTIKVAAIDFSESVTDLAPIGEPSIAAIAARQFGAILNALSIIVVAAISGLVALRLIRRVSSSDEQSYNQDSTHNVAELSGPDPTPGVLTNDRDATENGLSQRKRAQKRLEALVESDVEQAAQVIKGWLRAEA